IIAASAPGSSGFAPTFYGGTSGILQNLGETLNSGFEVLLTARPITLPSFSWESSVSLPTNDNEHVSFGDNRTETSVSGQSYGSMQRHREGYPLAGYWFAMPARDAQGNPIPLTATTVQLEDSLTFVGPSAPTREVSFSNTFTFLRDFRAFVLFDYK